MKRVLATIGCGCAAGAAAMFWTPTAGAGPLDPARVRADAKWVVHLDLERLVASPTFRPLLDAAELDTNPDLLAMQSHFGVQLTRDVLDVTISGPSADPENAAVVISATPAAERMFEKLREDPGVQTMTVESLPLLRWKQDGEWSYWHMMPARGDRRVVVVAKDLDTALWGIGGVSGKERTVAATGGAGGDAALTARPEAGALFYLETAVIPTNDADAGMRAMLERIRGVRFEAVESDDGMALAASLRTKAASDAKDLGQGVQGLLSLAAFTMQSNPETRDAAKLVRQVEVSWADGAVTLRGSLTRDQINEALNAAGVKVDADVNTRDDKNTKPKREE